MLDISHSKLACGVEKGEGLGFWGFGGIQNFVFSASPHQVLFNKTCMCYFV